MKDSSKNSDKHLDKVLAKENLQIAKRHLKRYTDIMFSLDATFGEVSSTIAEMVDEVLEAI